MLQKNRLIKKAKWHDQVFKGAKSGKKSDKFF